ncbi:MAG: hypothetical protein ICV73_08075 [Acetobacteraceae bacterium]|nr:hypothetical protein [Acetobacteraceae bacterium]
MFVPESVHGCLRVATLALAAVFGATGLPASAQSVEPIRFARGASGAEIRGAVARGERAVYSLEARGGQRMSLRIAAPERNAVFQVYAPGAVPEIKDSVLEVAGEALPGAGEGEDATRWTGVLPRTGAYLVVVGSTRGNATYRLAVSIR